MKSMGVHLPTSSWDALVLANPPGRGSIGRRTPRRSLLSLTAPCHIHPFSYRIQLFSLTRRMRSLSPDHGGQPRTD